MSTLQDVTVTRGNCEEPLAAVTHPEPIQPKKNFLGPTAYFRWKGVLDRLLAAALLVPGLPIIGALVLLVRITSPGPGIYRQVRLGKNGRRFMMYKIRSMRCDAEAKTGPVWTKVKDPRVTRLGKILRKLHLDELPQLLNVVRGEMSLIGPRPERPEIVAVLKEEIPGYMDRMLVCPGVTGLAQVNFEPDTDLDSVRRKLVLDLEYIEHATLLLDCRLFLCTIGRMFRIYLVGVLGLHRTVTLPESPRLPTADIAVLVTQAVTHGGHGEECNGNCDGNGNGHGDGLHEDYATPRRNGKRHDRHNGERKVRPR